MKVYKFKCDSCGSKNYTKTEDGYKCEYCGAVQDVIVPQQPETKEPERNDIYVAEMQEDARISGKNESLIIRLIICLFAGYLGIHKFLERKIFTGILYLCTGGLFGVGVIIDIIRYILDLIHSPRSGDYE